MYLYVYVSLSPPHSLTSLNDTPMRISRVRGNTLSQAFILIPNVLDLIRETRISYLEGSVAHVLPSRSPCKILKQGKGAVMKQGWDKAMQGKTRQGKARHGKEAAPPYDGRRGPSTYRLPGSQHTVQESSY